jgi:glycosyltransferase involved in cell wall biosynthesis
MQRGRLVIVSDIGSLSEVVGDAGMIFARGDAEGLAHCMQAAISDPSRCDDLRAKAASRIAQAFTFDEMIRGHIRCYEELHKH